MINGMKKKGKMYKIRKREGENVYDVRRKVKGRIKRKDGKKEGGNVIKERLTYTITYRYVGNFSFICKILDNCRDTYRPPVH